MYCTGVPQNSNSKCNSRLHSWLKNNYKIRQWIREQKTPKHFNRHFKAAHANHKTNNTNSGNGKASAVGWHVTQVQTSTSWTFSEQDTFSALESLTSTQQTWLSHIWIVNTTTQYSYPQIINNIQFVYLFKTKNKIRKKLFSCSAVICFIWQKYQV